MGVGVKVGVDVGVGVGVTVGTPNVAVRSAALKISVRVRSGVGWISFGAQALVENNNPMRTVKEINLFKPIMISILPK